MGGPMSGFDISTLLDGIRNAIPTNWVTLVVIALSVAAFMRSKLYKRIAATLEDLFFTNWRLGLLGATGLVLSAASGWTTWDGMKNFTGEPILSAMVTFGIQGVMLIVAWLIGESFATGMNVTTSNRSAEATQGRDTSLKVAAGVFLFGILLGGLALAFGYTVAWSSAQVLAVAAAGMLVISLFIVAAKTSTLGGYVDAMRVMVKSGVLWVMFLACAATSVFFSFDSLFSTIFPADERKRAAELRAVNQVAGVVADIGVSITTGQIREAEALFSAKGWVEYDKNLSAMARAAQESQGEIDRYFTKLMEDRRSGIAQQQERIATAQSSQAGLSNKKTSLTDELARLKSERPALVEEVTAKRAVMDGFIKELDGKRVEAMAEERGVEGTGKVGQGKEFRARKTEEAMLRDKLKIAEERLRDPQKKQQVADQRIVQIERELSTLDGDIAKLKGESQTAESRIKIAEESKTTEEGAAKIDPSRMVPTFERARQEFRQGPTAERLAQVQGLCTQILSAMTATPATKPKAAGIDCDPKTASETAARVFAINDGVKAFGAACQGGDKLAQYKTADALFDFARKCVQDSGLPSKDTDELRQKINGIELNRDDKANRFVVTWNAFLDGNRLAYLALSIAIAIDSLVFMSGLFGANAVRSPLSDVPSSKGRSAEQLEAIIDNALVPARFENARIAIEAMQADTSRTGYTAVVDLRDLDPERQIVVGKVLNAGATINAVYRDERERQRYYVRPELFEYLSIAGNRAFDKNAEFAKENIGEKLKLAQLEKDVSVALLPESGSVSQQELNYKIAAGAQIVLDHLHPYPADDDSDYRSELRLVDFTEMHERKIARRVLTAGSSMRMIVQAINSQDKKPLEDRYVLHTDFVKTLSRLRARMLLSTSSAANQIASSIREGGPLNASTAALAAPQPMRAMLPPAQDPYGFAADPMPAAFGQRPRADEPQTAEPVTGPSLTDSDLEKELVEHFAREMGQQSGTIEYLMRHAGGIDVQTLWRSLDLVLRRDDAGLRRPLNSAMKSIERSIDDARARFPSALMIAPGAAASVNDFADKLKSMTVVMVMLPGAAYDNLINKMEAELEADKGAGRLEPARVQKHRILVLHRSELARAEYSDDHWESVLQSLMKFEHGLAGLATSVQPPTRMS
jgi:hypothetical protein